MRHLGWCNDDYPARSKTIILPVDYTSISTKSGDQSPADGMIFLFYIFFYFLYYFFHPSLNRGQLRSIRSVVCKIELNVS